MPAARAVSSVIVIGGGIAGLPAAAAVAPLVERVAVIDRDQLPDEPAARAGIRMDHKRTRLSVRG